LEKLLSADDWEKSQGAYVANCLGMIVRWAYSADDFALFTDLIDKQSEVNVTLESVKQKILKMLDA